MKILMVCLGNICRSPLAEGILQKLVEEEGFDWKVDSAGTGSWHIGNPPDIRSIEVAKVHGLDISQQKARQFSVNDFDNFDLIFAMDSSNYINICKLAPNDSTKAKVKLILNESDPGRNQAVPDPYWNDNGFEEVYLLLEQACQAFIHKMK